MVIFGVFGCNSIFSITLLMVHELNAAKIKEISHSQYGKYNIKSNKFIRNVLIALNQEKYHSDK